MSLRKAGREAVRGLGCCPKAALSALQAHGLQKRCPGLAPTSSAFPTNLLARGQLSRSGVASGTNSGASSGLRASQRQLCCGAASAEQSEGPEGGSRRSPLTGTTPCLRRGRRVCPRVSLCGRAGLPEERGQEGGAPIARDSYLDLKTPPKKADLCKTSTFPPEFHTSHLP